MRYAVIMAGGGGTRLWPAARRDHPKQLQRLIFQRPLIAETVERMARYYPPDRILIVTAKRYQDPIGEAVPDLPPENIICEPYGRNTAAALALAALRIARDDPEGEFAALPADHVILRPDALFAALDLAHELCRRYRVVDIGVTPDRPETGYGYIELGEEVISRGQVAAFRVRRFVEKPDRDTAQRYLEAGTYIWNSGMFVWRASAYLAALREYLPQTSERLEPAFRTGDWERLTAAYAEIPDISVDYAIMERVRDVVAIPVNAGWRDIGDWAALYDLMAHDAEGNAVTGEAVTIDTRGSLLLARNKLVAAIGVEDLIVIDTDDALLVMPRDRAQEVKAILDQLRARGDEVHL